MKKVILFVLLAGILSLFFLTPPEAKVSNASEIPFIRLSELRFNYDDYIGKKVQIEGNYIFWHKDGGVLINYSDDDAVMIWGKLDGFSPKTGERVRIIVEVSKKNFAAYIKLISGKIIENEKVKLTGKLSIIGYQPFINLVLHAPDGKLYIVKGEFAGSLKQKEYMGKNVKVEGFIVKGDKIILNAVEVTKCELIENK